jgi:hypothetical protein
VRRLWPATVFVAAATLALSPAGVAQQPMTSPLPVRPTTRPYPRPSYRPNRHRPGQTGYSYGNGNGNGGVLIDGSVINRYLRTPAPVPAPKHKATPRPKGAPDVFEEHSTEDNQ